MEKLGIHQNQIMTTSGLPIRLRGLCLGGWMNMESFINGFPGVESELRQAFTEIIGPGRAEFFFERWLDYFITGEDIRFIKTLGANVVRVPLNYRHFESDARPFHYREEGFARLDRLIGWCRQNEIYVILDLHALPGGQNPDWHSDNSALQALFWRQVHFQDRWVALWEAIARRYTGDPVIAGYDLMNEPLVNAASEELTGTYRPQWDLMNQVFRRAVEAIRRIDQDVILFLEGDGFGTRFEGLEAPFAPNLAYSSHNYNRAGWGPGAYPGLHREGYWDRAFLEDFFLRHEGTAFTRRHQVPLWVGEFGSVFNGSPEDRPSRLRGFADQVGVFEQFSAHWTAWTYKDMGVMGWVSVDPQSEYALRVASILEAKLQLHSDCWMYWLPSTPAKEILGELAGIIQDSGELLDRDQKAIQGGLVRTALSGYASRLLQAGYARLFKGLSEVEIDRILQSFSLVQCRPNSDLIETARPFLAPVPA